MKKALAVLVLVIVAVIAVRIVVGFISGLVWLLVLVGLIAAALWAWSTLRSAKEDRAVKRSSSREVAAAPAEDPVAVEMRRITEELRERRSQ